MARLPTPVRKYPRIVADFPAECLTESATFRARASNLGGGGLFLSVPQPLTPGLEFGVRFRPAKHPPTIEAKARVIYQLGEQGIGIEFTEIKPDDREALLRLILHRIGVKRKFPRKPFVTQVEHEGGVTLGVSSEVSVGGMFIETKEPLADGSDLRLRFYLNGGSIVIVTAKVRYVIKGLGIGFNSLTSCPPTGAALRRM